MPKGFNEKAVEGFMQWMNAITSESSASGKMAEESIKKTRNLLEEGFPKVRR